MFNLKELEKWINKRGKYHLTWERDEEFNYITEGSTIVKIPRHDSLTDEKSSLYGCYETTEKEKLLKCERALFYHFMEPPEINKALTKNANLIQLNIEGISKLLQCISLNPIKRTGLCLTKGETLLNVYYDGSYHFYNSTQINLVNNVNEFMITETGALYDTNNHMAVLIMPVKVKEINKFLAKPYDLEV
ncbi:MAG: hypothetical protein N4A63_13445 [Vallitalea sp.]|jgi:hypothetical protein|nr:hypothetical protein [Vallitalea sp.]